MPRRPRGVLAESTRRTCAGAAAAMAAVLCAADHASATTYYWNGTYNANYLYSTNQNWSDSSSTGTPADGSLVNGPGANDIAIFNGTSFFGTTTVNMPLGLNNAEGIDFVNTGGITNVFSNVTNQVHVINTYAAGITMNSGVGAVTIGSATLPVNVDLEASQTWTNNSSNALTIVNQVVAGVLGNAANSLTTAGMGPIVLQGSDTYAGGTSVVGGSLILSNTNALGATSGSLTIGGGTLDITTYSPTVGSVSFTGGMLISTGSTTATLTGTSYAVSAGTISAGLGGATAALAKTTAGSLTLSGANSYGGGTTLSAGTVYVNTPVSSGSGTGSGSVTIAGGTLAGSGNVGSDIKATSGTLLPGPGLLSVGSLSTGGNVTLNSGTTFSIVLKSTPNATGVEGVDGDTMVLTGSKTFSANGATLQILPLNFASPGAISPTTVYKIVDASSGGGIVDSTVFSNLTAEATPGVYAYSSAGVTADVTFGANTISVQLDSVPEPAGLSMLVLGGAALLRRYRRSAQLADLRTVQ